MIRTVFLANKDCPKVVNCIINSRKLSCGILSPAIPSHLCVRGQLENNTVSSFFNKVVSGNSWMSTITHSRSNNINHETPVIFDLINNKNALGVSSVFNDISGYFEELFNGILNVKRTFQPSLVRRKRKHGFLHRISTRHGIKILHARRRKGRKSLCA
jgi:large subunit ribosomal protein L34